MFLFSCIYLSLFFCLFLCVLSSFSFQVRLVTCLSACRVCAGVCGCVRVCVCVCVCMCVRVRACLACGWGVCVGGCVSWFLSSPPSPRGWEWGCVLFPLLFPLSFLLSVPRCFVFVFFPGPLGDLLVCSSRVCLRVRVCVVLVFSPGLLGGRPVRSSRGCSCARVCACVWGGVCGCVWCLARCLLVCFARGACLVSSPCPFLSSSFPPSPARVPLVGQLRPLACVSIVACVSACFVRLVFFLCPCPLSSCLLLSFSLLLSPSLSLSLPSLCEWLVFLLFGFWHVVFMG